MYLNAMRQIGANTLVIENLLSQLQNGKNIFDIIKQMELPSYVTDFLRFTFQTIEESKTHKIAAVFTFGREDLIPDMFISMIKRMNRENEHNFDQTIYYFERHIEVDGDSHGPMALDMITNLCGTDPLKWEEAISASKTALQRRIALWDGINLQITQKEKALT
jgi:pyrroloquinoline quinone (PQQ) biosynthesis protein C